MQNRRPIGEVLLELRNWQREGDLSFDAIAMGSGVDLSSIYRLFSEDEPRQRFGSAVKSVCKFANISIVHAPTATDIPPVVRDAVLRTWDGSTEHANRLASAIVSVGELIRQAVSSKLPPDVKD